MPRYFFHIYEDGRWTRDEEGMELPNSHAAVIEARQTARDFASQCIREGKAIDGRTISVENSDRGIVFEFPLRDIREEF